MSSVNVSDKHIDIENNGPIKYCRIPIPPEGGGVVLLRGHCGSGKTHAIRAVRALQDPEERKRLRVTDGMPSGKIEGMGVTIRIGRSNTVRGELICGSVESDVDPSLFVDPGIKDPIAADSKRLATVIRLAGVKIEGSKWSELVEGLLDDVELDLLVSSDPVSTADKIRRRLHEVALKTERIAESKGAESLALDKTIADVEIPDGDMPDYQAALELANQELADLKAKRQVYADSVAQVATSKAALEAATADPIDAEEIHVELKKAAELEIDRQRGVTAVEEKLADLRRQVEEGESQLVSLKHNLEIATAAREAAEQRLSDHEEHEYRVLCLKNAVNASLPEEVTDEQLAEAERAKAEAVELLQQSKVVERARVTRSQAKELAASSARLAAQAAKLRTTARSMDQVLEQALIDSGFTQVKVYDGRLCVESDRGLEPVSELSTGERYDLILDIASRGWELSGKAGECLLGMYQEAWQGLDPALRRSVREKAISRGIVIVSAIVDEGELRAEIVE